MDLDHERRLTEVEARAEANQHRLDKVEARQDEFGELISSVKELAVREKNVENDVKEIKSDIKSITLKPAKRWESVVDKVIMTIAGAIIGFILVKLGL